MSIWFEGYGCTANQGETLEMREHANELGHELATDSTSAETVVLGTCTVIESTQNRMEKRMSELMDQGKNVIVSGCMATADTKILNSKFPNSKYFCLFNLIDATALEIFLVTNSNPRLSDS